MELDEKEKIYQVAIAPAANDRMSQHLEFLARVSVPAAENLLEKLMADIRSLEKMPFRNPIYNRPFLPPGKYRYLVSAKRYRIVYQIVDRFVFVDDIEDCRQDDDKSVLYPQ
jgi:hypothetical protein